jgi:hypothetical protein
MISVPTPTDTSRGTSVGDGRHCRTNEACDGLAWAGVAIVVTAIQNPLERAGPGSAAGPAQ